MIATIKRHSVVQDPAGDEHLVRRVVKGRDEEGLVRPCWVQVETMSDIGYCMQFPMGELKPVRS